ncbi:hypothetical protein RDI58_000741 [Solanum bulbocastanum]|uniref:Uncharacterized protein n=1 Tax=Solanum bulbocastanum TaxID=147425 RepID=A0AAN8U1T1_SOLBU
MLTTRDFEEQMQPSFQLEEELGQIYHISQRRCPRLKRLVMPSWEKIDKQTICSAFHEWKDLESLTMPSLQKPTYVIEKIGRSCKKISELKIMTPYDILFAYALVSFLTNLNVLSVRCTELSKPATAIL